jgi:signal transduction histidine kinase/CheY-like chemotaxis protein
MKKTTEFRVQFKALIIYLIVALGVIAMIIYLNNLRKNIFSQRTEIENQQTILFATNNLIFAVSEAQSSASLYLSTKNKKYFDNYIQSIDSVDKLINVMLMFRPAGAEKLHRIDELLREQAKNIKNLNTQFGEPNPVVSINDLLREYEPHFIEDSSFRSNLKIDTIMTNLPRKKFFQRLSEAFNPNKNKVEVVVNQETEKQKTMTIDSSAIVYQIIFIAKKAQEIYDRNMKAIEEQVGKLVSADREIASEVSTLLLEFHKETLDETLLMINNSEKLIERNYIYSIVGGILALGLILVFIILIIADINKGRKACLALEVANKRMLQIMESRHKLLLAVSHDIKSPLNSILGYLSLMKNDTNVRSMQNSSEHILSLLENLLEFSSLEQGTLKKSMSNFNLKNLFEDIYNMFLPLASQKSLALSFTADNIKIYFDRVKLKQIVINLVSNAIKYTQNGKVEFTAKLDENELKIEVKDTGAGISDEKISQLFIPFSRIEENNILADGTGLGMFVVKGLVDLFDGKININSKVNEGTIIIIEFPAERSTNKIPQGIKRIKIYDDDIAIIKVVSAMILKLGHKIVDEDYDLILTDMEMGNISGLDILHKANGIPVVLMTGSIDISTQKAIKLGFDGFLAKPFSIESLREIIGDGETLHDFMGENNEEIMRLFHTSAKKNFSILKQALADNNFEQAQAVCHKIFPIFAQMGYPTDELHKMDAHRNNEYKNWQKDVGKILSIKI